MIELLNFLFIDTHRRSSQIRVRSKSKSRISLPKDQPMPSEPWRARYGTNIANKEVCGMPARQHPMHRSCSLRILQFKLLRGRKYYAKIFLCSSAAFKERAISDFFLLSMKRSNEIMYTRNFHAKVCVSSLCQTRAFFTRWNDKDTVVRIS